MNRVIKGLWVGTRLSQMEQLSIQSFLAHGHEYHLYTYNELENLPDGAMLKDANQIIPSANIFKYKEHDSYAGFSNFFRYKLLLEKGGWWADTDLICLKPFDFEAEYVFSSEHPYENSDVEVVNVGAIKAPPGSPLLEFAWDVCQTKSPETLTWGEIGPRLFGEGVRKFELDHYAQKPVVFCPIPHLRWKALIDLDRGTLFTEETYAIHLWNEMWRRAGYDREDPYYPASFYERLKAKYLR